MLKYFFQTNLIIKAIYNSKISKETIVAKILKKFIFYFLGTSLFGRSLSSTALNKTPPMHNVGVQRSTPHFSDKYPYVRYSYGNTDTGLSVLTQTEMVFNSFF